jgi:hypothetical protein
MKITLISEASLNNFCLRRRANGKNCKKQVIWILVSTYFVHELNLSRFKQDQIMSCMITHTHSNRFFPKSERKSRKHSPKYITSDNRKHFMKFCHLCFLLIHVYLGLIK